ncbi:hypothetical protein EJB05_50363 [Eragrostis curvula]|uniref:Uncharacterized protein n=1 Tax=Eragrostis curvula TaxID=38414 RepID=A0A5J9SYH0_9POAL|nr:hypothetical protein EJB05_50363 [Eragrostis curvula]
MALRFLARRVGFPAAFRHRILLPYPSAGGSRSLTTKEGDHSDKVKFQFLRWKGSKVTGKEVGEQIAKCLVREDFKISEEGARELIFVKFGPIGKDSKVSDEDIHDRLGAILKAASNGTDTTRSATGDSWIQYIAFAIIAIAFTEVIMPSKPKKDEMERIKMEIERLQKENSTFRGIEHVVRALAVQGGLDYDALVQKTEPEKGGPRDGAEVEQSLGEDKAEIDEEAAAKMRAALEKLSKEVQKIAKGPRTGP